MPDRVKITDEHLISEFTPSLEEAWTVAGGDRLTIETIDSLSGTVTSEADILDEPPQADPNPSTGPIRVEGATPGDVLKVDVEAMRLREPYGRVITLSGHGLLPDHDDFDLPRTRINPIEDGTISFQGIDIPVDPLIGTIGVAPASDAYSTRIPYDHGGNLDTRDVGPESTIYLPIFQDGALLAMGDAKAVMSDGELCGSGVEIATEIDVTVDVIDEPAVSLSRPLIETSRFWKTVASAESLEEACRIANLDMTDLLSAAHGIDRTDAHMLSGLVSDLEISQIVNPLVTVRNATPKKYLSDPF